VNLRQHLYFMALVGAAAGLGCWFLQGVLADSWAIASERQWMLVVATAATMGALVGVSTIAFSDYWSADRVVLHWALSGLALGAGAGLLAGLVYVPVFLRTVSVSSSQSALLLGRSAIWLIAGGTIGFATGARWLGVNRFRALHALFGGLAGGAVGASIFAVVGASEVAQPLAFIAAGLGITLGVALAPVLLRDGIIQFVSSGDARAQNKYGPSRQEWVLQEGDTLVVGSQASNRQMTVYARSVDLYLPDSLVAPRHALLFTKTKRFFVQSHDENTGPQGQPLKALELNGEPVAGTRELRDGDDLVLGQTLLRFSSRKKTVARGTVGGDR